MTSDGYVLAAASADVAALAGFLAGLLMASWVNPLLVRAWGKVVGR